MTFTFRDVDGIRIRVQDSGSGAPILLIHGLGGSIDSWQESLQVFAAKHRVIVLDLPGFGQSDKPRMTYSVRFYTDFIAHFVKSQSFPMSIVGSSLGGQIASELAIKYPTLVSKLVLISPAGIPPFSFRGTPALRRYVRITKAGSEEEVKQILVSINNGPVSDEYAKDVYQRISMPGAREAFLSALAQSAKAPRLCARLKRIHCPVMVLWGQNDQMIPAKYAAPFMGVDNYRVVLIEHSGHRPHAEAPELFRSLVLSFLAD